MPSWDGKKGMELKLGHWEFDDSSMACEKSFVYKLHESCGK